MNAAFSKLMPGAALCFALAVPAWIFGRFFPVVGGPVAGIVLGLAAAYVRRPDMFAGGIKFTSKKILQWAIVLIGFDMNFFHVLETGRQSLSIIVCTIAAALVTAWIGSRILSLRDRSAVLIGVGTCICGGSAIAAAAPCIDASDEEIAKSISTIFLFNIIAAFLFPALGNALAMSDTGFGMWAGTAINDTSSVVAAATAWSSAHGNDTALGFATIVKLTRTLAIIPITIVLTIWHARHGAASGGASIVKIFPWFVLFFVLAAVVNTVFSLPTELSKDLVAVGKFMITAAMVAIGLNTDLIKLLRSSSRGLALGLMCWFAVAVVSLAVQSVSSLW